MQYICLCSHASCKALVALLDITFIPCMWVLVVELLQDCTVKRRNIQFSSCCTSQFHICIIDTGKWVSVWYSVSLSQTASWWNPNKSSPPPPTCISSSIKILFMVSVHHIGKAAIYKWHSVVKLSKQHWCECWLWSSGTDCLTKPFFSPFIFFLDSSQVL